MLYWLMNFLVKLVPLTELNLFNGTGNLPVWRMDLHIADSNVYNRQQG